MTNAIVNLDAVETNNCLSTCNAHDQMTVVEFNAERGRHWMSALKILKPLNADIVILNEMDVGMARSDQQHTASLLASALGMNYAWGMEFTELTRGTKTEQQNTDGLYNFLGLHGNAILSRCKLEDPIILRDDIGAYFSDKKNSVNADGYEKRLGGRMVMLVRIHDSRNRTIVVVRSIHESLFKLCVFFKFSYLVAKMGVGHRHGHTTLSHFLVTKIRPPRVTG